MWWTGSGAKERNTFTWVDYSSSFFSNKYFLSSFFGATFTWLLLEWSNVTWEVFWFKKVQSTVILSLDHKFVETVDFFTGNCSIQLR